MDFSFFSESQECYQTLKKALKTPPDQTKVKSKDALKRISILKGTFKSLILQLTPKKK